MTAAELTDWRGFERVTGPLGRERDDVLATMVAHRLLAAFGAKPKMSDLLPQWDRPPAQDPAHMQRLLKSLTVAWGGSVKEAADGDS